jgi:Tfp pilus assembly protein PilX
MQSIMKPLRNENGSVIVVAMIMLVLLTLIGISSTNTSSTEVQIAANNQNYQVEFYLADSGWRQGAMWLENRAAPPGWVNSNLNDFTVKSFGSNTPSGQDTSNLASITPDNSTLSQYDIPYWYNVAYLDPANMKGGSDAPEGNEKGYERMFYEIESRSNMLKENVGVTAQKINVRASKIYKVGY